MNPLSTITSNQIIPEARKAVIKFTKSKAGNKILPYFGSHYTQEDLVMDAVEKVVRANPLYLTKSYVHIAARCVCIDLMNRKKIHFTPQTAVDLDGEPVSLEDLLEGDIHDHAKDLHKWLYGCMSEQQQLIMTKLVEGKMYVDIAQDLGMSLRTLERQMQELKWTVEYLLTDNDPDNNPHSYLFR